MSGIVSFNSNWLQYNGVVVGASEYDPLNPLHLPAWTVRARFSQGYTPAMGDERTLVDAQDNIWDITVTHSPSFVGLFYNNSSLQEVLGANATGIQAMNTMFKGCTHITTVPLFDTSSVTSISGMFEGCTGLTSVPLFDTSSVVFMDSMFANCSSLTSVPYFDTGSVTDISSMFKRCLALTASPLFDTSSVSNMASMFYECYALTEIPLFDTSHVIQMYSTFGLCRNVQTGALALYQQASTQATPPANHSGTFWSTGADTISGAAELAQIPSDWK